LIKKIHHTNFFFIFFYNGVVCILSLLAAMVLHNRYFHNVAEGDYFQRCLAHDRFIQLQTEPHWWQQGGTESRLHDVCHIVRPTWHLIFFHPFKYFALSIRDTTSRPTFQIYILLDRLLAFALYCLYIMFTQCYDFLHTFSR